MDAHSALARARASWGGTFVELVDRVGLDRPERHGEHGLERRALQRPVHAHQTGQAAADGPVRAPKYKI
jgi:hypothetical protein